MSCVLFDPPNSSLSPVMPPRDEADAANLMSLDLPVVNKKPSLWRNVSASTHGFVTVVIFFENDNADRPSKPSGSLDCPFIVRYPSILCFFIHQPESSKVALWWIVELYLFLVSARRVLAWAFGMDVPPSSSLSSAPRVRDAFCSSRAARRTLIVYCFIRALVDC